jgi:hypothetical protein
MTSRWCVPEVVGELLGGLPRASTSTTHWLNYTTQSSISLILTLGHRGYLVVALGRIGHILSGMACSQGATDFPSSCDNGHVTGSVRTTCPTEREAASIVFFSGIKKILCLALAFLITVGCAACTENNPGSSITYTPEFLPVHLILSSSGVSIGGNTSLITPVGSFSIGASYQLLPPYNGTYVVLRNRTTGYDKIFEVHYGGNQFSAVINGSTTIDVSNGQVLIDVTAGNIKEVTFKRVPNEIPKQSQPSWLHPITARWDAGWEQSWYKPFALTRLAYNDSTIRKWYGIGFVWFLLRLILTIVFFIIDVILSLGFLLGQIGFLFFGATARNVIYGLLVLIALGFAGLVVAIFRDF